MQTSRITVGWGVALGATVALALAAIAPVALSDPWSGLLHHGFSGICHQLPERSIHLLGEPIALCHRCTGMLVGLVAGLVVAVAPRADLEAVRSSRQGLWLVVAVLPTGIDWVLGATGVWANTPGSRVSTGMIFGIAAGIILAANLLVSRADASRLPLPHAV